MTSKSLDLVIEEAERIWRARYPKRNISTYTAQMQIGALLQQARCNLKDRGVVLA